jgi:hypothetical protein
MSTPDEIIIGPGDAPGVVRTIRSTTNPGLVIAVLSGEEWTRRTGMGNHVSVAVAPPPPRTEERPNGGSNSPHNGPTGVMRTGFAGPKDLSVR